MKNLLFTITWALIVSSCTPTPEPIAFGSDICHFCKMTIVDQQHAAELVTKKGKVHKFDSIECMINFKKEITEPDIAFLLVNAYDAPKELVQAEESYFLISQAIPSPMGAYLTAFNSESVAKEMQTSKGGQLYSWKNLQLHFDSLVLKEF